MEIEKAREVLEAMHTEDVEEAEAVSMGVYAIRKQIPANLAVMWSDRNSKNCELHCLCGAAAVYPNKFCSFCGQALDFEVVMRLGLLL